MEDRRDRLKKVLGGKEVPEQAPTAQTGRVYARGTPQFEERVQKLKNSDPFRIKNGRLVGHGKWGTRINWGFWILITGFVLYCITVYVLIPIANRGGL